MAKLREFFEVTKFNEDVLQHKTKNLALCMRCVHFSGHKHIECEVIIIAEGVKVFGFVIITRTKNELI